MLSPAWPWSRSFLNISTPVTVFFCVSRRPTISISSPTFTMPRSTRPVTTVPRPEIENTSSIGRRKSLSVSRTGSGMLASRAVREVPDALGVGAGRVGERLGGRAADDRDLVAGEAVLAEELAHLELDEVEELGVLHQVALVEEDDHGGHVDLAREEDVLLRLRHRADRRRDDEDRAVHLRGARDHVLDVVGVARAVDVGVVPLLGLVLDVREGDRQDLGRVAAERLRVGLGDVVVGLRDGEALRREDLRHRGRQRRLAVVDVTDRADVDVGLLALEFLLGHRPPPFCSASLDRDLRDDPLGDRLRDLVVSSRTASCSWPGPA